MAFQVGMDWRSALPYFLFWILEKLFHGWPSQRLANPRSICFAASNTRINDTRLDVVVQAGDRQRLSGRFKHAG